MSDEQRNYTIDELAEQVAVSVRTVRYYVAEGLLPGPDARGKAAQYHAEHLIRLRLIRQLVEERLPLREIRAILDRLSQAEQQDLLHRYTDARGAPAFPVAEHALPTARSVIDGLLRRSQLRQATERYMPGVGATTAPMPVDRFFNETVSPSARGSPGPPSVRPRKDTPLIDPETWQRWEIAPGVELHIQGPIPAEDQQAIADILARMRPAFRKLRGA